MERLEALDWLRGSMALSILVYHSVAFADLGWAHDSSSVIGRLGIYGVSIFFVISGLSMAHAYNRSQFNWPSIWRFFTRRAFRIWPLLTLAVVLTQIISTVLGKPFGPWVLFINATGIFGFIDPSGYIATGAWSIGNELVFYTLTPPIIWAYNTDRRLGSIALILAVCIGIFFAFDLLSPSKKITEQWDIYVHPLNNLFLYVSGIAIYYHFRKINFTDNNKIVLLVSIIFSFTLYPVSGDQINLVTGFSRIAFSVLSIITVLLFYQFRFIFVGFSKSISEYILYIGTISYGVYLLHPFVIIAASNIFNELSDIVFVLIVICGSIIVAHWVYIFLERPMIKLGKYITSTT